MRLRSHLIALVLAVLVPMIAFSAIAIVMLGRYQRAASERGAVELARALMSAVDEHLRSAITTLEALASVRSLEHGDLRTFHTEARRVLATQPEWKDVILLAPDGRQLVDTARPWGEPLPAAAEPASVEAAAVTRRPVAGNVARGRLTGVYAVPVRVPVVQGERVAYVLTAVIKPEALARVALTAYGRTQDRVASLTAGYNMHVPKPVDPGEFTAIIASVAVQPPQT